MCFVISAPALYHFWHRWQYPLERALYIATPGCDERRRGSAPLFNLVRYPSHYWTSYRLDSSQVDILIPPRGPQEMSPTPYPLCAAAHPALSIQVSSGSFLRQQVPIAITGTVKPTSFFLVEDRLFYGWLVHKSFYSKARKRKGGGPKATRNYRSHPSGFWLGIGIVGFLGVRFFWRDDHSGHHLLCSMGLNLHRVTPQCLQVGVMTSP